jgi:hypothetical protein
VPILRLCLEKAASPQLIRFHFAYRAMMRATRISRRAHQCSPDMGTSSLDRSSPTDKFIEYHKAHLCFGNSVTTRRSAGVAQTDLALNLRCFQVPFLKTIPTPRHAQIPCSPCCAFCAQHTPIVIETDSLELIPLH